MGNPQVTPINEVFHDGGFIVSESPQPSRSRDQITLLAGAVYLAGLVLGMSSVGAATAAALGTNTGNGTFSAITVGAPATPGVYTVEFDDATHYVVSNSSGQEVGHGTTGAPFAAGGLGFTITAGGTAFVPADSFTITVAAGTGKYVAFDPTGTDGREVAAGILFGKIDATNGDRQGVAIVRDAQVNAAELVWGANVTTTPQKTAALATLKTMGIIAR
jgi:hypothetical protein